MPVMPHEQIRSASTHDQVDAGARDNPLRLGKAGGGALSAKPLDRRLRRRLARSPGAFSNGSGNGTILALFGTSRFGAPRARVQRQEIRSAEVVRQI